MSEKQCGSCSGKGSVNCPGCRGTGKTEARDEKSWSTCAGCSGSGKINCHQCSGSGKSTK